MHERRPYHPKRQNRRIARDLPAQFKKQRQLRQGLPGRLEHIEESNPQLDFRQFIAEVNRLLSKYVPEADDPENPGSDELDEETVAYYQVEGIIDPAYRSRWDEEEYGYRHLLQALLAKKLHAQGLGAERIRRRMVGRENAEYEEMLILGLSGGRAAERPIEEDREETAPPLPIHRSRRPAQPGEDEREMEEEFARYQERMELIPANAPWVRLPIVPGFEIHLSGDFKPPASPEEYKEIMSRLRQAFLRHFEGSRRRRR